MSREIPFDEEAVCDICSRSGAYDVMGDYICKHCLSLDIKKRNNGDE